MTICACDFDGCLCEHEFPEIGEPNIEVIEAVIKFRNAGNKVILWTCREGEYLKKAIEWCRKRGLEFDAVNDHLPEVKIYDPLARKIYADIYLDDKNISMGQFVDMVW